MTVNHFITKYRRQILVEFLKSLFHWLSQLGQVVTIYTLASVAYSVDFTTTRGIVIFFAIPVAISFLATFFNSLRENLDSEEAMLFSCQGGLFAASLLWKYGEIGFISSACVLPVFIPLAVLGGMMGCAIGDYLRVRSTFTSTI